MNYYFITGTSRGIGKAIAENLLSKEDNKVFGFSRSNTWIHANFVHASIDLNSIEQAKNLIFIKPENPKKLVLINNSGVLNQVRRIGLREEDGLISDFNVNLLAPVLLMNTFIRTFRDVACEKIIINISSGAARYPIESWAGYCSSKAGLDMFSQVVNEEQKLAEQNKKFKIFSIAPGIVDTNLQDELRNVSPEHFSGVETFIGYKKNNKLWSPERSAQKIIDVINNPDFYKEVLLDVRQI